MYAATPYRRRRRLTLTKGMVRAHEAWQQGDLRTMETVTAEMLERAPRNPYALSLWAECELLAGRWNPHVWRTWATTRWPFSGPQVRNDYQTLLRCWPEWDGTERNLDGVPIFVWRDAGQGDAVCFHRFVPLLEAQGATITWQGCGDLIPGWDNVGAITAACFVGLHALPGAFGIDIDSIPPPESVASLGWPSWRGEWPPKRIACIWTGNPEQSLDPYRSIYKEQPEDWGRFPFEWIEFPRAGDWRPSLEKLATGTDLVITVDTATFHVAATMGVPTWLLLPTVHYPIYTMDGRALKDWYPKARIFSQSIPGDWYHVLRQVERELVVIADGGEVQAWAA